MKRYIVTILFMLVSNIFVNADNIEVVVGDFKYILNTSTKSVKLLPNNYTGGGRLSLPEKITYNENTYTLTSIADYTFTGCDKITEIIIPQSVTNIGIECFKNCMSLRSISLPANLTNIGFRCFYECSSLESISIPTGINELGTDFFSVVIL